MQICRRGVAPFATGMSTIKYHVLPLRGTNPAWRQALLGRPAIAGCAPMLPRCTLCARRYALCPVSPLRYSVTSLFNPPPTTENPHEPVNPCNCNNCNHIFSHKLATFDFPRCPQPSAVLQTVPKSSTTHRRPPAPRLASRFTIHDSRCTFHFPHRCSSASICG